MNRTNSVPTTTESRRATSPRLVDIAARATAAAESLTELGNTPSERRIIAAVATQAMRAVFAEAARS